MRARQCAYNPNMSCPPESWICPLNHKAFADRLEKYMVGGWRPDDAIGIDHSWTDDDMKFFKKAMIYWLFPINGDTENLDSTIQYVQDYFRDGIMTKDVCRVLNAAFVNFERIMSDHADRFTDRELVEDYFNEKKD